MKGEIEFNMKFKRGLLVSLSLLVIASIVFVSNVKYQNTNNAVTNLSKTAESRKITTEKVGNYSAEGSDIGARKLSIAGIDTNDVYCVDAHRFAGINFDWRTSSFDDRPALNLNMGCNEDTAKNAYIQWFAEHTILESSSDKEFDKEIAMWVFKKYSTKIDNAEACYNSLTFNDIYAINQNIIWEILDKGNNGVIVSNFTEQAGKVNELYYWEFRNQKTYTRHTENSVSITKDNAVLAENGVVGPFKINGNGGAYKILVNATVNGSSSSAKLYKNVECTEEIGTIDNYTGDCYVKLNASVVNGKVNIDFSIKHSYISLDRLWYTTCKDGNFTPQSLIQLERKYATTTLNYSTEKEEVKKAGKFDINLVKTYKDTDNKEKPLAGVKFRITVNDGKIDIYDSKKNNPDGLVTDSNGKIAGITGLDIAAENITYTIKVEELSTPEGYVGVSGVKTFTAKSVVSGDKEYKLETINRAVVGNESNVHATVKEHEILIEVENTKVPTRVPETPKTPKFPEIHKGVKTVENQDSGYSKNEYQTWVINATIPEGIKDYTKYVITDEIDFEKTNVSDKRIKLVNEQNLSSNVVVKVKETGKELKENTDYKLELTSAKVLKITLIDSGINFLAGTNMKENTTLEITYKTQFVVDAEGKIKGLNQAIKNQAHIEVKTKTNVEKKIDSEIPEVHTGALGVFKYDAKTNKALEGAHFKLTTSEQEASKAVKAILENDTTTLKTVKFVKVIGADGKETSTDVELITGKDGHAMVQGLEFGEDAMNNSKYQTVDSVTGAKVYKYNWQQVKTTYYVIETQAPSGYSLLEKAESVDVKYGSFEELDLTKYHKIANTQKIYDLSLRKFITQVQDKSMMDRMPKVSITDAFKNGSTTTCTYTHSKDAVMVKSGDIVTYTLRVYNEGPEDAYAAVIKDDIPAGLELVSYTEGDGSVNAKYAWKLVDENDNQVTDKSKAKYVVTEYLSMTKNKSENLIKGFDSSVSKNLDYRDVKVQFKVVEPNNSEKIITNYAQISKMTDSNGKVVTDRDSTPNKWVEGEDDQDIENIKLTYFDLSLRKWVTKAIVTENGQTAVTETGHKAEDNPEQVVKVDLKKANVNNVTVKFEYKIRVKNEGKIAGYADQITDHIPEGLKFEQADNSNWTVVDNNTITTTELSNKLLNPGESAEVTVVLTWVNSVNNIGVKKNVAEISKDRNSYGINDIDSTPGNYKWGEDDIDDAPVMLSVKTGNQTIQYVLLSVAVATILGVGIKLVRKVAM